MPTKRTFIKSFFLVLSILLLSSMAQAKSCLWKVSTKGGTLYLQGSVHVLRPENYPLAPAIEAAYAASKTLVLEVDMTEMTSPKTQQMILAKAMLPEGQSLEQALSPEVYAEATATFTKAGLPIAAMQRFKPWFAAMTLTLVRMQSMGFDSSLGLDTYFHNKATAEGKQEIGLESVEFQINLIDSLAEGNQNEFMKKTLKDLELMDGQLDELMTAWQKGNIEKLGKLINESFEECPGLYGSFIAARNKTGRKSCMPWPRAPTRTWWWSAPATSPAIRAC